jgi:hypothetical protein
VAKLDLKKRRTNLVRIQRFTILDVDVILNVSSFAGLSSYAEDPKSAAESISKLLHAAKSHIPEEQWATTPITLKATAGNKYLRLFLKSFHIFIAKSLQCNLTWVNFVSRTHQTSNCIRPTSDVLVYIVTMTINTILLQ